RLSASEEEVEGAVGPRDEAVKTRADEDGCFHLTDLIERAELRLLQFNQIKAANVTFQTDDVQKTGCLSGLRLDLSCLSVGGCKAGFATRERNRQHGRVVVHSGFLMRSGGPAQNAHIIIFKRDFTLLRSHLDRILRQRGP